MTNVNRNPSVEFIVKPKHDLYLEGTLRKLPRVRKGESYPCQMQKNQSFSCLFRHYAKHNGLRKEDLIFTFVDELQPDQTPETVHLMPHDEIWVEHRNESVQDIVPITTKEHTSNFNEQFRLLFENSEHTDIKFDFSDTKVEIFAHKCILIARSEYFRAMFHGGMSESNDGIVKTNHDPVTFKRMLEFIYSNSVRDIESFEPSEIISLLVLANEYLLEDLRLLCEKHSTNIISMDNISQLLLLSAGHNASVLKEACARFVTEHKVQLATNPRFRKDIEMNPELGVLLFEASLPTPPPIIDPSSPCGSEIESSRSPSGSHKRRRLSNPDNSSNSESELDLMVPQLGTASNVTVSVGAAFSNSNIGTSSVPQTGSHVTSTFGMTNHSMTMDTVSQQSWNGQSSSIITRPRDNLMNDNNRYVSSSHQTFTNTVNNMPNQQTFQQLPFRTAQSGVGFVHAAEDTTLSGPAGPTSIIRSGLNENEHERS